jgi:hypothetical protein
MIEKWIDERKVLLLTMKHDFWANHAISELARSQGVAPIENIDELCADTWPADELVDEFLTTIRSWRKFDVLPHPTIEQAQ